MICIHHNDLDGRCAAAIVAKYFPGIIRFIEMDYKDVLPDDIRDGQNIIIVDFSLKPEVMERLVREKKPFGLTWIDHHATAKDYPYQGLPGLRDFTDKGRSGCELTWNFFFPDTLMPMAVQLIGDYDKWALKMPDSKAFYEGMKLQKNGPEDTIWMLLLADHARLRVDEIISAGRTAMTYRDAYCNGLCKNFGYETELDGVRAYACNQYMFGSGGFVHRFHEYPMCIAYIHDGKQFTVSLYSETVDVGLIAKNHGGGGHKGAAGFVCVDLPWLGR